MAGELSAIYYKGPCWACSICYKPNTFLKATSQAYVLLARQILLLARQSS